jgi:hypothetical protein
MTSPQEFSARAALCRQLAKREPDSKNLWLAEAERWSRLKQEPSVAMDTRHDEPAETWCWEVIPKRRPRDIRMTGVQFGAETSGEDPFLVFLTGLPLERREPN